jgi:DNA-binding NtrC family response regulator
MPTARILVVDDDELILTSLSEFLRLEGYGAATARNYAEASAQLAAGEFQVVIADVSMPETDGLALLKMIRNRYPETAVVMVTGYGTIENAVEAIKRGAFDYMTKPTSIMP